jgi:hypothetical protein
MVVNRLSHTKEPESRRVGDKSGIERILRPESTLGTAAQDVEDEASRNLELKAMRISGYSTRPTGGLITLAGLALLSLTATTAVTSVGVVAML